MERIQKKAIEQFAKENGYRRLQFWEKDWFFMIVFCGGSVFCFALPVIEYYLK